MPSDEPILLRTLQINPDFRYKSKMTAALLAALAGAIGMHRFYLGQRRGFYYLLLCWTLVPYLLALVEALWFLGRDQEQWNEAHNQGISAGREAGILTISVTFVLLLSPLLAAAVALPTLALPAYRDHIARAEVDAAYQSSGPVLHAVGAYFKEYKKLPNLAEALAVDVLGEDSPLQEPLSIKTGELIIPVELKQQPLGNIHLKPLNASGELIWRCYSPQIPEAQLPRGCYHYPAQATP
ncbi:MAG: NINE protein [Cellvibrionaceae bacterium]|nr:NINE protein [Cellvibrionaceae bacterium]MCV6628162.1 NINE protein [Cellvibrionaceae bacterium]